MGTALYVTSKSVPGIDERRVSVSAAHNIVVDNENASGNSRLPWISLHKR